MPEERQQMMRMRVVDMMVEHALLSQKLKDKGLTISDEQVMSEIQKIAGAKTMEDVEKEIKEMGMTMEDLRGQVRQKMMTEKVIDAEMKDAVTAEDAKKYYDENPTQFDRPEQVQASHILVKVEPDATADAKAEAKKKIEGILKKVKDGGDFAALAKENSDCPSAANGGDLGMFGRGQMVKEFEDTAFAMKPGDVSGIVETQFGYHIIKVTDKKEAGKIPFEEIKDQLESYLKQRKQQEFWQTYRDKMKADAKIEYSAEEKALREKAEQAQQQMMQQQIMQQMQMKPQTEAAPQPEQAKPDETKPAEGKAAEIKPKTEEKK
jgi:peptidyl-prolyl cis-trans isomerase C